jgi:peptidoglycan/LPS O-acetylase OafA/YrhL
LEKGLDFPDFARHQISYIVTSTRGDLWVLGFKHIFISSYLFEFAIGLLIGFVFCHGDYYPKNNHYIALCLFLLAFTVFYFYGHKTYKYLSVGLVVAATLCLKDSLFNNPIGRFLCSLGHISYSTYLVHSIILIFLLAGFGKRPETALECFMIVVYLCTIYGFSLLSHRVLERGAFNSYLKDYLYRLCRV